MRLSLTRDKRDNAWTETDRRERQKLVAITLALLGALGSGLALLIYALTRA
jgi:hypothetical protein